MFCSNRVANVSFQLFLEIYIFCVQTLIEQICTKAYYTKSVTYINLIYAYSFIANIFSWFIKGMTEQACGSNLRCAVWIYKYKFWYVIFLLHGDQLLFSVRIRLYDDDKRWLGRVGDRAKKTLSEIAHHLLAQGHEIADPPKLVSIRDARRPSSLSLSSFNHVYISKICKCAR